MKKIILITFLIFINNNLQSQNFKELYEKLDKFQTQEQFDNADKDILKAVDYLLTHKYNERTDNYFYAFKSMIKWMDGTTKYAIIVGGKLSTDIGEKTLMMNMFMAGMAKYLLVERFEKGRYIDVHEQKEKKFMERDGVQEIQLNGAKILFDYVINYSGISPNKNLKKAMKANDKGKLHKYMFE